MPRLVLIGECMVEMAGTGQPDIYRLGFAGDTFNTAWYARRGLPPDWDVDYVTAVGRDAISERMLTVFAEAGIGSHHVQRSDDRTVGLYMISTDSGERSFSYWRSQSAARAMASDRAALDRAFAGAAMVYLSGITLAVLEGAGRTTLLAALAAARAAGCRIAFDSNLRPRLWPSSQTMCDAVMEAAAISDLVMPSFDDEAAFFGDADPEATSARYRAAGAGLVVVKNGPGDVLAVGDEGSVSVSPDPVFEVIDTTAAGDSFNAGFLAAHLTGADLAGSIRRGAALAGRVVQAHGALVDCEV